MARTKALVLGDDIRLPLDAVTQSIGLQAVRGAGKSNAAVVLAEEMYDHGLAWVAIDPKGDWWGIRSGADGNTPGLPVPVLGGLHGDLPLQPEAGAMIAELVVDENLTCVLDVSEFSKAGQTRFLTDFAERLFRLHGAEPHPRHLFLEEADEYLPQRVMANQARCVGAFTKLVKQGRSRGLGISLISQRSAVVNKDALTQVETLIALRTTSPQDRKAILGWVDYHAVARELVESLPSLAAGEAWVCSPHWLGSVARGQFHQRRTFDSGATPKFGATRRPATIADIDLGALKDRMAEVVEAAEQKDPKRLRRRVADLERQLAERSPEREVVVEKVVEVAPTDLVKAARAGAHQLQALAQGLATAGIQPGAVLTIAQALESALTRAGNPRLASTPAPEPARAPAPVRRAPPPVAPAADGDVALAKADRAILSVLAQFPDGRTKRQLGLLTGYSAKGGGFNNALSKLRTAGFVLPGDPIVATAEGLAAVGDTWEPLPTGRALVDHWVRQLAKAEGLVLQALVDAWPEPLNKVELAERTGYAPTGGGFNNALSRLRTLELIRGSGELQVDDTLGEAGGG